MDIKAIEPLASIRVRPEVSIIIPAYNGKETILSCIASVLDAVEGRDFEILVVESSADGTEELLQTRFPEVKVVTSVTRLSAGQARNQGIQMAEGRWLFFVDQDCIVPPDWIFRLLAILSQEGVGGVGGSISVANPKNLSGWCVYFLEFLNHFPSYSKQATSARHLGKGFLLGANSAWRSEVFRSLSFPDQTLGEDLLLSQAVRKTNFSIIYDPTISVCHYNRSGWREFQRYCQDMGKSAAQDQRKIADWRFWLLEHFPLLSFGIPLIILPLVGWRLLRTSPGYMGRFLLLLPCCLWGQLIWAASFRQSLINSRAAEIHHH